MIISLTCDVESSKHSNTEKASAPRNAQVVIFFVFVAWVGLRVKFIIKSWKSCLCCGAPLKWVCIAHYTFLTCCWDAEVHDEKCGQSLFCHSLKMGVFCRAVIDSFLESYPGWLPLQTIWECWVFPWLSLSRTSPWISRKNDFLFCFSRTKAIWSAVLQLPHKQLFLL